MSATKHFGLPLVSWLEGQTKRYKDWWLEINGDSANSAFNIIDKELFEIKQLVDTDAAVGMPGGIAPLDNNSLVPKENLPSISWNEVTDKPTTIDWSNVANKPASFAAEDHKHNLSDINDIQDVYDYVDSAIGIAIGGIY